jgi:hypothetical protein
MRATAFRGSAVSWSLKARGKRPTHSFLSFCCGFNGVITLQGKLLSRTLLVRLLFNCGAERFESSFAIVHEHLDVISPDPQRRNLELKYRRHRIESNSRSSGDTPLRFPRDLADF